MSRISVSIFILSLAWSCCNVKDSQQAGSVETPRIEQPVLQRKPQSPAVFKQNVSVIEGVIDSVIAGDGDEFRIIITILSSMPEEDIASFAESGQQILCAPEYFIGESGMVDGKNNRNIGLRLLKDANKGNLIKARLSLGSKGDWKITEVLD
jgi:hypothetical protein